MFRICAIVLPCAAALRVGQTAPRGDYNIDASSGVTETSFPEFNVQYDSAFASNAALNGDKEASSFAGALEGVLAKQEKVISSLENTRRASLVQGYDRVTQSPMVWLNVHGGSAAHASLVSGPDAQSVADSLGSTQPLAPSMATVNVFEQDRLSAPGAMLLQPQTMSAPFEVMDFFVERGQGALLGEESLKSLSKETDELVKQIKPSAALLQAYPVFNLHVASAAGAASYAQQVAALNEAQRGASEAIIARREKLIATLQQRRERLNELRASA